MMKAEVQQCSGLVVYSIDSCAVRSLLVMLMPRRRPSWCDDFEDEPCSLDGRFFMIPRSVLFPFVLYLLLVSTRSHAIPCLVLFTRRCCLLFVLQHFVIHYTCRDVMDRVTYFSWSPRPSPTSESTAPRPASTPRSTSSPSKSRCGSRVSSRLVSSRVAFGVPSAGCGETEHSYMSWSSVRSMPEKACYWTAAQAPINGRCEAVEAADSANAPGACRLSLLLLLAHICTRGYGHWSGLPQRSVVFLLSVLIGWEILCDAAAVAVAVDFAFASAFPLDRAGPRTSTRQVPSNRPDPEAWAYVIWLGDRWINLSTSSPSGQHVALLYLAGGAGNITSGSGRIDPWTLTPALAV